MAAKPTRYFEVRTGFEVHAMRLIGNGARTMAVCNWLVESGYPWLIGNALKPETLKPHGGKSGDQGIYLDPSTGSLCIVEPSEIPQWRHQAKYGDWVFILADGTAMTATHEVFQSGFSTKQPVGAPRRETNG